MKIQRQATDWEKIFGKHTSYKGFVYKIFKELFVYKKTNNTIKNWVKFFTKHFTKEDI